MTVNEPPLGYTHALTIDEAVGRMIGYEAQPMPFDEVLDCAIEQADSQYERAKDCDSPADKLSALEDRIQHLTLTRTKAMILHNELHTVADELAQGLSHPTLVLCSIAYADRLPRFTIASLYPWAKSCHATEIPEWAPQTQTQLGHQSGSVSPPLTNTDGVTRGWADVSIQLLTNNRIRHRTGTDSWTTTPLSETKFVDRRKGEATQNQAYETLTWVAVGADFGSGRVCSGRDKARRDKLCKALVDLIGIEGNPFTGRSPREGYKPHFTVEDMSTDSIQSSAWDTRHEEYDDNRMYDAEDPNDEGW